MLKSRKRVALHIGAHKTGSSSLQASLLGLDLPSHRYVSYAKDGNESGPFISAFTDDPMRTRPDRYRGFSRDQIVRQRSNILRYYDESLKSSNAHTFIFSGEAISKLPVSSLKQIKDFFEARDCDIEIFIYMRPLQDVVPSIFQQVLTAPPSSWANNLKLYLFPRLVDLAQRFLPGYPAVAENLLQVFPRSAIHFLPFTKAAFPQGDVVLDFVKRIDLQTYQSSSAVRVNEACSVLATKLLWLEGLSSSWTNKDVNFAVRRKMVDHLKSEFNSSSPGMVFGATVMTPLLANNKLAYDNVSRLIERTAGGDSFDLCSTPVDGSPNSKCIVNSFSDLTEFTSLELRLLSEYAEKYGGVFERRSNPVDIAQSIVCLASSLV
jgi:hypothetical protein